MGNKYSTSCASGYGSDDGSDSHTYRRRHDDSEDDNEDSLNAAARDGHIPSETLEEYIKQLLDTYPGEEIMRLTILDPPTLVPKNPTIASLAKICLQGVAEKSISPNNIALAFERIAMEGRKDAASNQEAIVVLVDIGLAILRRFPHVEAGDVELGSEVYLQISNAFPGLRTSGLDAGTLKKGAWVSEVADAIDVGMTFMRSEVDMDD
jgi:hypothetical protein